MKSYSYYYPLIIIIYKYIRCIFSQKVTIADTRVSLSFFIYSSYVHLATINIYAFFY
ncbi:hypothetical protein BDA99DRAFT_506149 [Phascolomyces articulosus]|uniref:Uncharacterized protein n=1 Tax=Phascolomyces articulosus TaxID=60185 RepID=A0AAD5K2R4_9FUNG|nr:hypothetical protein BDA99DRAFT_506149 [Phascolomyces articulosus]